MEKENGIKVKYTEEARKYIEEKGGVLKIDIYDGCLIAAIDDHDKLRQEIEIAYAHPVDREDLDDFFPD